MVIGSSLHELNSMLTPKQQRASYIYLHHHHPARVISENPLYISTLGQHFYPSVLLHYDSSRPPRSRTITQRATTALGEDFISKSGSGALDCRASLSDLHGHSPGYSETAPPKLCNRHEQITLLFLVPMAKILN